MKKNVDYINKELSSSDCASGRNWYMYRIKKKEEIIEKINKRIINMENLQKFRDVDMIDNNIRELAKEKYREMEMIEKIMKENAIDCRLFSEFHNRTLDDKHKIRCYGKSI